VTLLATPEVEMVKVADEAPAGTVTDGGTTASELDEARATATPPDGAGLASVTVPVAVFPPMTEFGEIASPSRSADSTASVVVCVLPPCVAVIVAFTVVVTADVPTANVTVVDPTGTVTDEGTFALEILDARFTTQPPFGAGPFSVTVPVAEVPPISALGATDTPMRLGGLTVSITVWVVPFWVAVIVAETIAGVTLVVMLNVADDEPAGIITEPGMTA